MTEEQLNDRKAASELLRLVRIGNLSVREAMLKYPKDTQDESLVAAYHALIHYEADEDIRARDNLYREEQDDYIEFLADTLARGENLPQNIIDNYKQYYEYVPILHKKNLWGFFKSFWKNLNVKED
ncbi:hypothetical protein IJ596_08325 [bacterium]|nr:hypothetical protein [bacterium]